MFEIQDFSPYQGLEHIVLKLNKLFEKNKSAKVPKVISQLEELLIDENLVIPVTFILSVIAENSIEHIPEHLIKKIEPFLNSQNGKLKINSIIIMGFKIITSEGLIEKYISDFIHLLTDDNEDIRENTYFFLGLFFEKKQKLINSGKQVYLNALKSETKKENVITLLEYLSVCKNFSFSELFEFRDLALHLILKHDLEKSPEFRVGLLKALINIFPLLKNANLDGFNEKAIRLALNNLFIMKKTNFTAELIKKNNISLERFTEDIKKNHLKEKELYFYTKNPKTSEIIFYQIEKEKLEAFFNKEKKISNDEIKETFGSMIDSDYNLRLFIDVLLNLGQIFGFYSKLGFYYPQSYITLKLREDFQKKGLINLKNYNYLPIEFLNKIIKNVSETFNIPFLTGVNEQAFYSLKKIHEQINNEAPHNSSIDLYPFRERLKDEDFIKLIKNLPREYLTNLRKGTHWLTNIGKTKIKNEIDNSKIIGFFSLPVISEKLNIKKILLVDVLEQYIDLRGGIWDNSKEIFYYSKFLKDKINSIDLMSNDDEKNAKINALATQLNINKNIIVTKINENLKLLGEEIKNQDEISISLYLEKLGMEREDFMNFIHDLEVNYFLKGDLLILNPEKIELAKKDIKLMLIKESQSMDYISFGNFDINADLVHSLIKELEVENKIKGIFYEEKGEVFFYTLIGIKKLMLENSFLFSFSDLFYGKELDQKEIALMMEVLDELIDSGQLKGTVDKKELAFSSDEVIFAKDYNVVVDEFGRIISNFTRKFEMEFYVIKKILRKRDEVIYPQEIKLIQEIIDKININYVKWRAQIGAIMRSTNKRILDEQGHSFKSYQRLPPEKRNKIILFKEDPDVQDHMNTFNAWVNLFNELELNYGKIIFAQKHLINNPEDTETEIKLEELLEKLKLL